MTRNDNRRSRRQPKLGQLWSEGSLSECAYEVIREQILRGKLPLGATLSRRRLAVALGMSLLPISEALQRLESEGLVESKPRVGTRVCVPTPEDIRDSYIIREALESQSARLFVQKASPQERRELCRMAEHTDVLFNRCVGGETDPEFLFEVHTYHCQLHLRIAECTGSKALRQALDKNHVLIFNWLFDVSVHHQARPPRFHRELAEVLCGNDAEAADAAMRKHIRYGLEGIVTTIQARAGGAWRLRRSLTGPKKGSATVPGTPEDLQHAAYESSRG
ncbi:MAG: GntR family transcriptional regulator [Terriglobia bacterium]